MRTRPTTFGRQENPQVTLLSDGRALFTWVQYIVNDDLVYSDGLIRARIYDLQDPSAPSEDFTVNTTALGDTALHLVQPQVIQLADERVVFTWASADSGDGSSGCIRSVMYEPAGTNHQPVVSSPVPDQGVAEDTTWNYTLLAGTFTDQDGDSLTLSASLADGASWPSWLAFNAETRTFSGTLPQDFNGFLDIKVTASDSALSASDTFRLVVTPENDAPEVAAAPQDQSVAEDSAWSFSLPAGTFTDMDGDSITLSATLDNGSALPSWLTFNAGTGTFSGVPADGDVGILLVRVTASDGTSSVSDVFTLTVTDDAVETPLNTFSLMVLPSVEELSFTGTGAFTGTGNALDNVITSRTGNDILKGLGGNDLLTAAGGIDTLRGGVGADQLLGGTGRDTLDAGVDTDADRFVFNTGLNAKRNVDTILNFDRADRDKIVLDDAVFTSLLLGSGVTERKLTDAEFTVATEATTKADRIIYDQVSGSLYYDADGSRSGAMVKVAQLNEGQTLSFTDILIT